nr:immunoglobulin heavy chain junction region [Macaca mulatta]MOX93450.1 immunoglobulin heavy chain junction region [Macaca mulatta]MOX93655.1 immunoglobulin heavy chain junction region [Macaca mulatta]MOX94654.1 immunoglobulin heavy chain junction region [Macaca mulatta]MOX95828.1 immunoglobulin heavy chain junction region [Macaca mulatta]
CARRSDFSYYFYYFDYW